MPSTTIWLLTDRKHIRQCSKLQKAPLLFSHFHLSRTSSSQVRSSPAIARNSGVDSAALGVNKELSFVWLYDESTSNLKQKRKGDTPRGVRETWCHAEKKERHALSFFGGKNKVGSAPLQPRDSQRSAAEPPRPALGWKPANSFSYFARNWIKRRLQFLPHKLLTQRHTDDE